MQGSKKPGGRMRRRVHLSREPQQRRLDCASDRVVRLAASSTDDNLMRSPGRSFVRWLLFSRYVAVAQHVLQNRRSRYFGRPLMVSYDVN